MGFTKVGATQLRPKTTKLSLQKVPTPKPALHFLFCACRWNSKSESLSCSKLDADHSKGS